MQLVNEHLPGVLVRDVPKHDGGIIRLVVLLSGLLAGLCTCHLGRTHRRGHLIASEDAQTGNIAVGRRGHRHGRSSCHRRGTKRAKPTPFDHGKLQ